MKMETIRTYEMGGYKELKKIFDRNYLRTRTDSNKFKHYLMLFFIYKIKSIKSHSQFFKGWSEEVKQMV